MKKRSGLAQAHITFTLDMLKRIDSIAQAHGISRSEIIRRAVVSALSLPAPERVRRGRPPRQLTFRGPEDRQPELPEGAC